MRANKLCFYCGEKWDQDHKCSKRGRLYFDEVLEVKEEDDVSWNEREMFLYKDDCKEKILLSVHTTMGEWMTDL